MTEVLARLSSRAIAGGLGVLLLIACSSGGGNNQTASSTDVTVWSAWGGNELKAYQDVLKPFESSTGIKVHLTTVRDANQLAINVDAGTSLPDIAPGPSVDKVKAWVEKGTLKSVETALGGKFGDYIANTYPALTTTSGSSDNLYIGIVGGKHYELMVKTQVKGLFWYNKKVFTGTAPKTFDELLAINPSQYGAQKLFCAGLESGGASGWPASDQIDNIIMRQSGDKLYTDWIQGKVKFTDPAIKLGYQTYLKEVSAANVYGGPNTVLSTAFQRAGKPLFAAQPGCLFLEQATFIPSFFKEDYPNLVAGTDFDFFGHPSVNPQYDGNVNGFYHNLAMYNDTPAAPQPKAVMAAQDPHPNWANESGQLAAIKSINYTDPVYKRAAEVAGTAKNLLVTAGDFMPTDMQAAFWKSLLNVTRNPSSLDSELARLDQVQKASYTTS